MLSLTRCNPFVEMNTLHRELDRAFGWSWDGVPAGRDWSWVPATEVASETGGWNLRMALPGIDPKDVQVTLHGDRLTVTGERRAKGEGKTEPHHTEFGYGRFERSFTLPDSVDAESISASFEHGMLELTLPVAEAAKPRRVEITDATSPKAA